MIESNQKIGSQNREIFEGYKLKSFYLLFSRWNSIEFIRMQRA